MKLDMDFARRILLDLEESDIATGEGPIELKYPDRPEIEATYHVQLLNEAGLIEAECLQSMDEGDFHWYPKRLTWEGHQFLDASRDEGRWKKVKDVVKEKTGGLT